MTINGRREREKTVFNCLREIPLYRRTFLYAMPRCTMYNNNNNIKRCVTMTVLRYTSARAPYLYTDFRMNNSGFHGIII